MFFDLPRVDWQVGCPHIPSRHIACARPDDLPTTPDRSKSPAETQLDKSNPCLKSKMVMSEIEGVRKICEIITQEVQIQLIESISIISTSNLSAYYEEKLQKCKY